MAESPAGPPERLACGASVDELLEQVAAGDAGRLTPHQAGCQHCQVALTEFDALWAPVRENAAGAVPATPPVIVANVMAGVQRLVRDTWYTLELADGGSIQVAARVVAVLARRAAARVPGVRVVLGRSTAERARAMVEKATLAHRHPHAAVAVLGRTASVDLAVSLTYGPPALEVADLIRRTVTDELQRSVGLRQVAVNVTIDDIGPRSG